MAQQQLPEYHNSVKLKGATSVPSFQAQTSKMALNPSTLGELGAKLAMGASIQLSEQHGYELGQNPQGDVLPPITKTDEAFVNAYHAQSQATLGLQAHQMMQQGQIDLAQAPKLTPELVSNYEQNMSEGLQQILENAPSQVKPSLANQFNNQLLQTSGNLNLKMISQQKEDERQNAVAYNQTQAQNIFEYGLSNNFDAAKESLDTFKKNTQAYVASGTLTPAQGLSANHAANLSYWSGVYSRKAVDEKNNKREAQFLEELADEKNKPDSISFADWQQVQKNVMGYVQNLDNLERKDTSLMLSQLDRKLAETGSLSPQNLSEFEQKADPTTFNNFMAGYANFMHKEGQKNQAQYNAQIGWSNSDVFSRLSTDAKNQTFDSLVAQQAQKNPDRSIFDIQTDTAMSAAGIVPAYVNTLSSKLQSTNPDDLIQATQAYKKLSNYKASNIATLPENSIGMYHAFNAELEKGSDPQTAAENAQTVIFGKDPDRKLANNEAWRDFRKNNLSDLGQRASFAKGLANIEWGATLVNPTGFYDSAIQIFENNFKLLNGDVETAKKMTREALNKNWGHSYINGQKEFGFLPVEKALNLPENSLGVIKNSEIQLSETKNLYDRGLSDYYYELKPYTTLEQAQKWSDRMKEIESLEGGKRFEKETFQEYFEMRSKLTEFNKGQNLKVVQKWRDNHTQEYELMIKAGSNVLVSNDSENPVMGNYDILIKNKDRAIPLNGLEALGNQFVYRPSVNAIKKDYINFMHVPVNDGMSDKQRIDAFIKSKSSPQQSSDPRLSYFAFIPTL